MKFSVALNPIASRWTLGAIALLSGGALSSHAAPYTEATVTRVHNKVSYGEQKGAESVTRPATPQDVVAARNFLLSEVDSRAELKYPDGTIVRIGQNTVFTFESDSRTLNLKKGTFVFYVPKGQGGATIKTPSLTAAITGTVGFAAASGGTDKIGIVQGSAQLPSGQPISTNQYASRTNNGPVNVNPITGNWASGNLWTFNGSFPPFQQSQGGALMPDFTAINTQETLDRTANQPGAFSKFFPIIPNNKPKDEGNSNPPNVVVPNPPVVIKRKPNFQHGSSSGGEGSGGFEEVGR